MLRPQIKSKKKKERKKRRRLNWLTLKLEITSLFVVSKRIGDYAISNHGQQVSSTSQHECKRVRFGSQVLESFICITQKVHHSRTQKHTPSKLCPQNQEPLVPFKEVRWNATNKSGHKYDNQAPYFHQYQWPCPKVNAAIFTAIIVAVIVATVSRGREDEEEE